MKITLSNITAYKKWLNKENKPLSLAAKDLAAHAAEINKDVRSFIAIDPDVITNRALSLEKQTKRGSLWGVPVALKDNICIKGGLTTCGSRILEGFRPPYNATVATKLQAAGALLMGRANMDEFAFGSSCETSCYGPTRNPRDLSRIPGGSSGGSCAAVAAAQVVAALGSDTGGSVRQPASLCGVVGLKPTYGRVSRFGLVAFASSLDQIGPVTTNVEDCARMLEVISGHDAKDSTSVDINVPEYTASLERDIKDVTIGIPKEYFTCGISKDVSRRVQEAIKALKGLGAKIVDVSLPHTKYAVSCYYIIAPAEASSNLARYEGVHYGRRSAHAEDLIEMYIASRNEGFGAEAKRRILLGTYALSSGYYDAYYLKAQKVRTKIADDFRAVFTACDCILTPTSPTTAFKIGERIDDPLKMYLSDIFTIPANLAGLPAISVPCGEDKSGLPVGLQFMAGPFKEEMLIRVAHAYERSR
ncbi:MAG: Asp-tRNA(Asn)/Glu-tRNA(Gln) amidotransferase subunit GatA [Candidatus Omnitrophica bacterium]|nr:Asp-tRNA(Asn)/Glu-tRNA(Gln) amidotransferase subunit GatA [Candidatus Omnitrophota bacterium]MBU1127521.1 Asp-tRNA(Asn)/Glu-tRNA(Gln) amidotransferase subunit GatA [Candidatus Omnitrophota bacterium]MBU1657213.1 Asp-tRNA(Asn)/Glu-tRNA(Gln) amidotransferase subunit GatA [Candidatus Omnitrophota bacterium]MBU1783813.1 Asp-tRNA(Asn)/Glu-tRNA(Gln) amidotransferase subunit GatA [Candidatus Omnitrophota bacterium]MBU1851410.1 Asp-tRNA(Asn)/Glu-tRNA(Gln) amidotransferase subunit GatA [Candidatus Om